MSKTKASDNFYNILLSYEIPYNILDSQDQNIVEARNELFEKLKNIIPSDKYEKYFIKLTLNQQHDTLNYIVTYSAFFRSQSGLPMEEYVGAKDIKDKIASEIENFFNSVDCDYRKLNIKTLL